MTRKDFILIASVLNSSMIDAKMGTEEDVIFMITLCGNMADELADTNKQFDRMKFLTACGVYDE